MADLMTDNTIATDSPSVRIDDLAQIVEAYSKVSDKLQHTHEALNDQVQRLQAELASANAELQRSKRLAALGEMAAGIAHEIRNPLGSIQLYANLLEKDLADKPNQRDLAEKIAEAVRGLDSIVCDVLTFSREVKVSCIPGDARMVFERAIEAVKPLIESASIDVVYDLPTEAIEFHHDRDLLHQAMVNLIRNAAEAMTDGGTITLCGRCDGNTVTLNIGDTGPGIDDSAIDRIFNPFFTTRATGTGLGLAIVHRIIEAHRGTISVHNNGGAKFVLTLPQTINGVVHHD